MSEGFEISRGDEMEGCDERLSGSLGRVREAMMGVENALATDAVPESWDEAIFPAGDLTAAAEDLQGAIREQHRKAQDEADPGKSQ